jgi:uncharacterized protein
VPDPLSPTEEESICLHCGLCCKGAVLSGVRLLEEERHHAERLGIPVLETPVGPAFAQPCSQLMGNRCRSYQERPKACGTYRCKLLEAVESGQLGYAEAKARVGQLLTLIKEISRLCAPVSLPRFFWSAAHASDPATLPDVRARLLAAMGEARVPWQTLRGLLDNWINSPSELTARRESGGNP